MTTTTRLPITSALEKIDPILGHSIPVLLPAFHGDFPETNTPARIVIEPDFSVVVVPPEDDMTHTMTTGYHASVTLEIKGIVSLSMNAIVFATPAQKLAGEWGSILLVNSEDNYVVIDPTVMQLEGTVADITFNPALYDLSEDEAVAFETLVEDCGVAIEENVYAHYPV